MATSSKKITTAQAWKKTAVEDLELPSGNVARVRRPDLVKLINEDLLPDTVSAKAQEAIDAAQKGKRTDPQINKEDISSTQDMVKMFLAFDKICVMTVVEPTVMLAPENHLEGRRDDVVYTDDIDLDDKMFIFNWAVGGTRDVETFRRQYGAALGDVSPGEGVGVSAE